MKKNSFTGVLAVALGVVTLVGCNKAPDAKVFTVKFTNGNELVQTKQVKEGDVIVAPEDPKPIETKEATYTFDAWYDQNSNKFVAGTVATKDVEYSAKFTEAKKVFTVTFVDHEGNTTEVKGKYGETIVAPSDPEPYQDGKFWYEFSYWHDGRTIYKEGMKFTRDRTFTAEYDVSEPVDYVVTFFDRDMETVVDTMTINAHKNYVVAPEYLGPVFPETTKTWRWKSDELPDPDVTYSQKQKIIFKNSSKAYNFYPVEGSKDYTVSFFDNEDKLVDVQTVNAYNRSFTTPKFPGSSSTYYTSKWDDGYGWKLDENYTTDVPELKNFEFKLVTDVPKDFVVAAFEFDDGHIENRTANITNLQYTAPTISGTEHYKYTWVSDDGKDVINSGAEVTVTEERLGLDPIHYKVSSTTVSYTWKFKDKKGDVVAQMLVNIETNKVVGPYFKKEGEHYEPGSGKWYYYEGDAADPTYEFALKSGEEKTLTAVDKEHLLKTDGVMFNYTETPIVYNMTFTEEGKDPVVKEVTIENNEITTPALPPTPGATYKWIDESKNVILEENATVKFDDLRYKLQDYNFVPKLFGQEYTVTLNANGGTITGGATKVKVKFGEAYNLPSVSPKSGFDGYKFAGWYDSEDKLISNGSGTWTIASDITLYSKWEINMDGDTVPSFINSTNPNVTLTMAEAPFSSNDGKVLKASYTASGGDQGFNVGTQYLKDMMAQENVVGIAFEATFDYATTTKTGQFARNHTNFRTHLKVPKAADQSPLETNATYEAATNGWGLSADAWKTFVLKKEYLDFQDAAFLSNGFKFLICGNVTDYTSFSVYVRNIHPITQLPSKYDFETGGIPQFTATNRHFRTAGFFDDRTSWFKAPTDVLFTNSGSVVTNMMQDSSQKSKGNVSLKITKTDGYAAFYLPDITTGMGADGYVEIDIRSTVDVNSKTAVNNFQNGIGGYMAPEGVTPGTWMHPKNRWITYRLTRNDMTSDCRFLIILGSSAGDWWFDNVRVNLTGK